MDKKKLVRVVEIIATAVVSIVTVLFIESCTVSMSLLKNSTNSKITSEQSQATSVDSTHIDLQR